MFQSDADYFSVFFGVGGQAVGVVVTIVGDLCAADVERVCLWKLADFKFHGGLPHSRSLAWSGCRRSGRLSFVAED